MAELKNLRNDFMKSNADTIKVDPFYKNSLGNPKVNFYLADTIIGGGTEKGIIRIATVDFCNLNSFVLSESQRRFQFN